jgi:hypothetical protein
MKIKVIKKAAQVKPSGFAAASSTIPDDKK